MSKMNLTDGKEVELTMETKEELTPIDLELAALEIGRHRTCFSGGSTCGGGR